MHKHKCKKLSARNIVERPSPNFNDRRGHSVQFLIIHYTAMSTAESAIKLLCDPKSQVSAHYVVDEQAGIYRLVDEENRAWHAGVSYWEGHTDLNSSSVGIEIANTGDSEYPQAQMDAVISLSRSIVNRHNIPARHVIGHSDIAPDRKQDPGALFDWTAFARAGLGVWPTVEAQDYDQSKNWSDSQLKHALIELGYRPELDLTTVVTAFQRHFQPESFKTSENVGVADSETKARLASLLRNRAVAIASAAARKKKKKKRCKC